MSKQTKQAVAFELAQIIAFELRRGGEDSAPVEYLNFDAVVKDLIGDELIMKFEFEHADKISIGSQSGVIIAEITNADFFS